MNPYVRTQLNKGGQSRPQTDVLHGVFKGVVEDSSDSTHTGRIKVRVYSVHGDYRNSPTDSLPWAECAHPLKGSFNAPERFDRVWVMFENGDKNFPVWFGYWYATPAGRGKLPHNSEFGVDTPMENWSFDGEWYPQTQGVARSSEGNGIWFEDVTVGAEYHGAVVVQNSGSMFLRMRSRLEGTDYRPRGGTMEKGGWSPKTVYRDRDTSWSRNNVMASGELELCSAFYHLRSFGSTSTRVQVSSSGHYLAAHRDHKTSFRDKWGQDQCGPVGDDITTHRAGGLQVVDSPRGLDNLAEVLQVPEEW